VKTVAIIEHVPHSNNLALFSANSASVPRILWRGQVAQVVERSPEKAGVGGSTPSLATILFNGLANRPEISHL
jgi:hypothetical protein